MRIRVMLSGRGYDAAQNVPRELELAGGATLEDLLRAVSAQLSAGRELPSSCLIAVSGEHIGTVGRHADRVLCDGDEVALIAPVAGG